MDAVIILIALAAGLGIRQLGYPPLPGYLLAGFVAHALSLGDIEVIKSVADIGILLLLFTIGLKLNLKELLAPQVWAVTTLHMASVVPLTAVVIMTAGIVVPLLSLDTVAAWSLAFALSFSSTVFAVKMFDDRGETSSFHATLTIGVLVIQDILAVAYLVLSSGQWQWSMLLVLLVPLFRWPLTKLMDMAGHGELLTLFGILCALGAAEVFYLIGLKGGLGALMCGMLLSEYYPGSKGTDPGKARELYSGLSRLKDLLLVGFFLQIGYYGLPSFPMLMVALVLSLLIFMRPVIYYFLYAMFNLRARTALLASAALFTYSEFGLIVAALSVEAGLLAAEWLTTLAIALSLSFVMATPLNMNIHRVYDRLFRTLHRYQLAERLPEEQPTELGDAKVVILGMGRVGRGAYEDLNKRYPGQVVGVEESFDRAQSNQAAGLNCVTGDAVDHDFWSEAVLQSPRELVLVSLTNHSENMSVVQQAKDAGYTGNLAVVSRYPDEEAELTELGCITFNLYAEAGHGFAEHVIERLESTPEPEDRPPERALA
ncbi:MAG: cation:proton antiporter [Pseudomonadota bacterium]